MQKTLKYGGRKELPSSAEIDALCTGRLSKRQTIMLPGSLPLTLNLKPSSVVQEVVTEILRQLDRVDPLEEEEYALFDDHGHAEKPMSKEDYIFDHFASDNFKSISLSFRRVTWFFPLQRYKSLSITLLS